MVDIPLPPRSHHKANKLTDEEQEKRNKKLSSSSLTKGFVKIAPECSARKASDRAQEQFRKAAYPVCPATFYPVCPVLRKWINEKEGRRLASEVQYFNKIKKSCSNWTWRNIPLYMSISRILRVERLIQLKPDFQTIVEYAHTKNLLKGRLDLIRNDLLTLPQRLERGNSETSKKCKGLIERLEIEIAEIVHEDQLRAFLVPNGLEDGNWDWADFLSWRQKQVRQVMDTHFRSQLYIFSLTRYYPIKAFKAMRSLRNTLSPIFRILSEEAVAENPCNANFIKIIEEFSDKLTKPDTSSDNAGDMNKPQKKDGQIKKQKEKAKTIGNVNIETFTGILGDVQAKNLQIGDNARIDKQPVPEKSAETEQNRKTTIFAIIISFIVDLVFELLVYFVPITWVKNHPNSYGLQGSIIFLIPCLIVGLFKPQYRKWCWGVGAIAFIVLLLSLMGGPADSNVN